MRWYVVVLVLLLIGCKKEDEIPPVISITSPFAMTQFQIPFQVTISGFVEDENVIEWIKIVVLNDGFTPSSDEILINTAERLVEFNEIIYLDNIHLSSGVYYIKVSANDGENIHSSYVQINILEFPLVLKDIFVLTSSNSQTNLLKLDSNSLEFVDQFDGSFQIGNSISKHQYLFIGTNQLGNAFNPNFNQNIWDWSFNTFLSTYFNDSKVTESSGVIHICCSDGVIRSFTENGVLNNTVYSNTQELFDNFLILDNYLYAEVYSSALVRYLSVYFLVSGIEIQRVSVSNNIVDILNYNTHQCLFLEQNFSDIEINMYDRNTNVSWTLNTISNDSIYDAEYVLNKGLYFISNTGLMLYNVENNILTTSIANNDFKKIRYDNLNGQLYLLTNNEIWLYSTSTGQYQTIATNYNLKDILLFYNK